MPQERLQKFLSNAGIASRRRAEVLILAGKVKINGKVAKLGDKVDPATDKVEVSGKTIRREEKLYYIAVNKPKGYITSRFDPKGRKSVYDIVPKELRDKVWSIGRLDFYTEGLIIFTNDGELTQTLSHPKFEHEKEYEILVNKDFTQSQLDKLRAGVEIGEKDLTSPAKIKVSGDKIRMTIHEGKKRQIRRMFEAVGLKVRNLKRIRENKLLLADLPLGKYKFVTKEEII
jgi:pseudouridine synthase